MTHPDTLTRWMDQPIRQREAAEAATVATIYESLCAHCDGQPDSDGYCRDCQEFAA